MSQDHSTINSFDLYMSFCERGQQTRTIYDAPDHRPAAKALVDLALREGALGFQGAWRLDSKHAQQLEQQTGLVPPGGWQGLAGVLAGCDVLRVVDDGFVATTTPQALGAMSAADLQRTMIEALTIRLIPPATAAGLFLLVGIHPAWGLRLAYEAQPEPDPRSATLMHDPVMFPPRHLPVLERAVFTTLGSILSLLQSLPHDRRYPIDALAELVGRSCELGRTIIEEGIRHPMDGRVPVMITHLLHQNPTRKRHQRAVDFTLMDLIDAFLVPCGIVRRFDDQTISVNRLAITDDVRIGHRELTLREYGALTKLLANDPEALVA